MLNLSPYDTTAGKALSIDKIEKSINVAVINTGDNLSYFLKSRNTVSLRYITGSSSSESIIPFYDHPVYSKGPKNEDHVVTDLRPFLSTRSAVSLEAVTSQSDFDLAIQRSVLTLAWVSGGVKEIRHNFGFAGLAYASWISETVSRRFSLDPREQLNLFILTHLFYQMQFMDGEIITDDAKDTLAIHTIKATKASADMVYEIMDREDVRLGNLADYCNTAKAIIEKAGITNLNPGLLVTMLSSGWFGYNSDHVLAVALEHPPTWIAIIISAINNRSFKNSAIARNIERHYKKSSNNDIELSYQQLKNSYTIDITQNTSAYPNTLSSALKDF